MSEAVPSAPPKSAPVPKTASKPGVKKIAAPVKAEAHKGFWAVIFGRDSKNIDFVADEEAEKSRYKRLGKVLIAETMFCVVCRVFWCWEHRFSIRFINILP